jgi:hypothetical protein
MCLLYETVWILTLPRKILTINRHNQHTTISSYRKSVLTPQFQFISIEACNFYHPTVWNKVLRPSAAVTSKYQVNLEFVFSTEGVNARHRQVGGVGWCDNT